SEVVTKPWLAPRNPVSANTFAVSCCMCHLLRLSRLILVTTKNTKRTKEKTNCAEIRCVSYRPFFVLFVPSWSITVYVWTSIDDGDFFDRKLRGDLGTFFRDHHHFFEPHAPLKRLAVLSLQGKTHPWLDRHGKIERIDTRDDRGVVLS